MPGITPARRRPFNTRGRSSSTPRRKTSTVENAALTEPPRKKRRYVPGGPGGGGRYVEVDGTETSVGGTGPGGYNYTGPKVRDGHRNTTNGARSSTYERPPRPRRESRREKSPPMRPRFSSAQAAAAAMVQGDGFKPREERGWEEFHQDLDIEHNFVVFEADEVDGRAPPSTPINATSSLLSNGIQTNGEPSSENEISNALNGDPSTTPIIGSPSPLMMKRGPGRPPRRQDALLKGIGLPATPKVVPSPGPNPRERLTLLKPQFRIIDPFTSYEKANGSIDYVDRTMAHVGYQESDRFMRPENGLIRLTEGGIEEELDLGPYVKGDGDSNAAIGSTGVGRVEYDMDEQDLAWLDTYNQIRKTEGVDPIKPAIFEVMVSKIEKEWHALEKRIPKPNPKPPQTHRPRSSSAVAVNGEPAGQGEEQDSKCAICDDGDCENTNAIVFCDGCDLAVHQECYGVPFIPEGQWLCRKCHLIGRGTPTCIFCPNTDGAFKQTNSSRWAHLLCAIWIPEVSLGNATFMEPVMDVEKVPKSRWKLQCTICQQKMGACIQCSNKNCFRAFHVTCARRARWFLSMKSANSNQTNLDAGTLKAYCDKHVSAEWAKNNDVQGATSAAFHYYHYAMRGKIWADSQQSSIALAAAAQRREAPVPTTEDTQPKANPVPNANKRKTTGQSPKSVWRLPSGAPVIPSVVLDSVEASLQRFTIRKRKEFAADMCRFWTLKREAKRGAALIKRLQLQMETFSSMEITRRNFAGMASTGAMKLQRRIEFAEARLKEIEQLRNLVDMVKEREHLKLQDAYLLRDIVETVYFPITPLLWPILEKAIALDNKSVFRDGLFKMREALEVRFYVSVAPFARDLALVLARVIGMSGVANTTEVETKIDEDRNTKKDLTQEEKEIRKLAKRITRAIQPALDDASRKEAELCRRPYEEDLQDLGQMLDKNMAGSVVSSREELEANDAPFLNGNLTNGVSQLSTTEPMDLDKDTISASDNALDSALQNHIASGSLVPSKHSSPQFQLTPASDDAALGINDGRSNTTPRDASPSKPPTPPMSAGGDLPTPLSLGGIPWYMEPFDPAGTTIFEERWTGRDVQRAMSDELSDINEDDLSGLIDGDMDMDVELEEQVHVAPGTSSSATGTNPNSRKKNGKLKKRWRGFR